MPAAKFGPNGRAARKSVRALRKSGAVGDEHEALLVAFVSMADQADRPGAGPDVFREYRMMARDLREVGAGGVDDEAADVLLRISTPGRGASLGHSSES